MRATEIIRAVLDLIDGAEQDKINVQVTAPPEQGEAEASRFKQIFNLLSNGNSSSIANAPDEHYADIESVTTDAGGGLNGPKHPDDIRVKDPRGYE